MLYFDILFNCIQQYLPILPERINNLSTFYVPTIIFFNTNMPHIKSQKNPSFCAIDTGMEPYITYTPHIKSQLFLLFLLDMH